MKRFLHVGCGADSQSQTPFASELAAWRETRMDLDPAVRPHILGSITDMSAVANEDFDAVYSSHNIEHIYFTEVPQALKEFRRVLKPSGFALVTCPDLQSVCALIAEGHLTHTAYLSPAGPIAPMDIVFGFRPDIAAGKLHMAHKCGFTQATLTEVLQDAGFGSIATIRRPDPYFDLWALALANNQSEQYLRTEAAKYFPT